MKKNKENRKTKWTGPQRTIEQLWIPQVYLSVPEEKEGSGTEQCLKT